MNIEKLEIVLEEMRAASFSDLAYADNQVRKWADQIGDAITEHLLAELSGEAAPRAEAPDLGEAPGGHDWNK